MKDKCHIWGSPLGWYSVHIQEKPGESPYIISIINQDGSLNEKRCREICADISRQGGNGVRDWSYWIEAGEQKNILSPFIIEISRLHLRKAYIDNQQKIAAICNEYNLIYWFSLFDHVNYKYYAELSPWPWDGNFYHGKNKRYRNLWVSQMVDVFQDYNVGYSLCNEPGLTKLTARFLADTFIKLIKKGIDPKRIEIGIDYGLKEHVQKWGKVYRDFREFLNDELSANAFTRTFKAFVGRSWSRRLKTECLSPVHNASLSNMGKLLENARPGGDRGIVYSGDGLRNPRPDYATAKEIATFIFKKKYRGKNKFKVHFEFVYGKQENDPLDSIKGVSDAYNDVFGKHPENYGKEIEPKSVAEIIVRHAYLGILWREPDPASKGYVKYLQKNLIDENEFPVFVVCKSLVDSGECKENRKTITFPVILQKLYLGILRRGIDQDSIDPQVKEMQKVGVAGMAKSLLTSNEFNEKFLNKDK